MRGEVSTRHSPPDDPFRPRAAPARAPPDHRNVTHALTPVLGHPRVLREAGTQPHRRVVDHAERLDGVAAWEPLFGRHGEGVVALRDTSRVTAAADLFRDLLTRAAADGIVLVRFVLLPGQDTLAFTLAADVPGASVGEDLTVRLA